MSHVADILTVNITGRAPLIPGDHYMEVDPGRARADVIDTRYQSETRAARSLWMRFDDDFALLINDGLWTTENPFEAGYRSDGLYVMNMRLSGDCLESVNRNTYSLGAFTCSMIHYGRGVRHVFRMSSGEPLVEVCAVFRASFFMKRYNMTAQEAEALLNPPKCRDRDPWFNRCGMTPEMEALAHKLRSVSPSGKTWRVIAEAKTLEMLSLYLEQLEQEPSQQRKSSLAVTDLRRLNIVREYLGKHYSRSPRIDDLCRMVGLNRRKLTEGFKSEFGRTVFEYVQYRRMEQARALFQSGFTDVNSVAKKIGYAHQGNFTKAFKRYVGMSPRKFAALH